MDKVEKAVIDLNGEWPDDRFRGILSWNTDGYEGDKCGFSAYITFTPGFPRNQELVCTYEEFMETRKRLENKPSWDDAPGWANYLAQDGYNGKWWAFENEPFRQIGMDCWDPNRANCKELSIGHVFGDWRQSLERRPNTMSKCTLSNYAGIGDSSRSHPMNHEHQDHKEGEGVNVLREKYGSWIENAFEGPALIGYKDWYDWMMSKDRRFSLVKARPGFENPDHKVLTRPAPKKSVEEGVKWEPGVDLPPVGATNNDAELVGFVGHYDRWEVVAVRQSCAILYVSDKDGDEGEVFTALACHFAPLKSHRDKCIEAAVKVATGVSIAQPSSTDGLTIKTLNRLYDAGLLRLPNNKEGE